LYENNGEILNRRTNNVKSSWYGTKKGSKQLRFMGVCGATNDCNDEVAMHNDLRQNIAMGIFPIFL
jgi:hypothetical protein